MSFSEYVDMLLVLGECHRNYRRAAILFEERYSIRKSHMAFKRLEMRLRNTGRVSNISRTRAAPVVNEVNRNIVLNIIEGDHEVSSRQISADTGISQRSVLRILHKNKWHPYHVTLIHDLSTQDFHLRKEFCIWIQNKIRRSRSFLKNVLFSDEAIFRSNGNVNRHNLHYWSQDNPRWSRNVDNQHRWSLNVWCGLIDNCVIGPYFFEEKLTGKIYADFLMYELPLLVENVSERTLLRMWFQQDGAPPHYANISRNVANQLFGDKWIGRGGPIAWPPRSPDLTPLDFFLWGHLKNIVMSKVPTTKEDMKERIVAACRSVTPEMLRRVRESVQKRLQKCIEVDGRQFEHLINS